MKKNNALMRASGILLVLTLGTSCFVGGTFAKYVSEDQGDDTARVAKWGVTVAVENAVEDLFEKNYDKHYTGSTLGGDTVISSTEMDVFAPGTEGTLGTTSITGTPEVTVKVDTDATVTVENWNIDVGSGDEFYCPLIFTVTNGEGQEAMVSGITCDSAESLKSALENEIEKAYSKEFAAGTTLDNEFDQFTISWEWPYVGNGVDNTYGSNNWASQSGQTDEKDTALGNKAAAESEDNAPKITVDLKTTVTQID